MLEKALRTEIRVDIGLVRGVVALALEEPHEVDLPVERALRCERERPVERDANGGREIAAVERIETLSAPRVVRLPGVDRNLNDDLRVTTRRLADDEGDVATRARFVSPARQAEQRVVVAGDPARRDRERVGDGPAGTDDPCDGILGAAAERTALPVAPTDRQTREQTGAATAIPAEPVHLDPVPVTLSRRDVETHALSRQDARLGRVALDTRGRVRGREPLGRIGTGQSVLHLNRVGWRCGIWSGRRGTSRASGSERQRNGADKGQPRQLRERATGHRPRFLPLTGR